MLDAVIEQLGRGYWLAKLPNIQPVLAEHVRNTLALSELRFHKTNDPLGKFLADAFVRAGAVAWPDVGFKYAGHEGDIDCLVLLDGALFFFECKNALHPCGFFELRNTWQHLDKASVQLGRIDNLLKTGGFIAYLSAKLGHDLPLGPRVGAIVLGHRILSGYNFKGFEVRSVHELFHFIRSGDGTVLGQPIRLRPEGPLTANGMQEFLTNQGFYERVFGAMAPFQQGWTFHGLNVVEHTYRFDPESLAASFNVAPKFEHSCPDGTAGRAVQ
jgi:hypothetical protein